MYVMDLMQRYKCSNDFSHKVYASMRSTLCTQKKVSLTLQGAGVPTGVRIAPTSAQDFPVTLCLH